MAYFGRVNPATYGLNYSPITAPGAACAGGGHQHVLPERSGTPAADRKQSHQLVSLPYAKELRNIEPLDRAGPTLYFMSRRTSPTQPVARGNLDRRNFC